MSREELANLPGRPEEQGWLRERMEVLTVREGIALDAALQRGAPADARDAVNLLANLDEYAVVGGIQSYEDLGLYDLEENDAKLLALRDYIDLDKLGRRYEEQHPGLFVGGCYVIFPERELLQQYDGVTLPGPDCSWSLRLKLASPAVPEGVWLALPDYNDIIDVRPGEIRLALDALGVQTIQECTLLEARCSLPGVTGLETAYDGRLEDLIYDGQNLGFILQEQNQGQKDFLQTYLWVLEHERCTTLPAALDLAQNLNRYQVVRADHLQDFARMDLRARLGCADQALSGCIDLERYGLDLLRNKGYTWALILLLAVVFGALVAITTFSGRGNLDSIKSKTVGDGQHGTARWATPGEVRKTFRSVPFRPALWRKGEQLPDVQGLVLGCTGKKDALVALVDADDVHCLMIGASGVGKTAFFLYPNLEYACASGMSFFASDTKGDLARNYGAIARGCYGYQVAVVDLRNPTRSDGYNLLTLINHYMDVCRKDPANLGLV